MSRAHIFVINLNKRQRLKTTKKPNETKTKDNNGELFLVYRRDKVWFFCGVNTLFLWQN